MGDTQTADNHREMNDRLRPLWLGARGLEASSVEKRSVFAAHIGRGLLPGEGGQSRSKGRDMVFRTLQFNNSNKQNTPMKRTLSWADVQKTRLPRPWRRKGAAGEVRNQGGLSNDLHALEKWIGRLRQAQGKEVLLHACYEAGPCGLDRAALAATGADCAARPDPGGRASGSRPISAMRASWPGSCGPGN